MIIVMIVVVVVVDYGLWTMDSGAICAFTFVAGSLVMLMMVMTPIRNVFLLPSTYLRFSSMPCFPKDQG